MYYSPSEEHPPAEPGFEKSPWGKAGVPDERWESAGLIAHDDDSPEESPPSTATPRSEPRSIAPKDDIREAFEVQALRRPRPTTPVQNCAIETFVATTPASRPADDENMKINLPPSVAPPSMFFRDFSLGLDYISFHYVTRRHLTQ